MKIKYTLAALAALTVGANAATILTQATGGANGSYSGQSFAINDGGFASSGDALTGTFNLNSVTFTKGNTNIGSTTTFVEVYNGATFLGSSTNSFDWSGTGIASGTAAQFDFSGITGLTDATTYTFRFSSDAVAGNFTATRLSVGTVAGSPLTSGNLLAPNSPFGVQDAAFDAVTTVNVTAVPEPSSTALLGLGGLALILRRRK